MKRLMIGFAALLFGMASPAHAASIDFRLVSYDVSLNTSGPGLNVWADDSLSAPYSFSLDAGETWTTELFTIGTSENEVNLDDWFPFLISVGFVFDTPVAASGTTWGITGGGYFGSRIGEMGYVVWHNPLSISFGTSGILDISLNHATFGVPGSAPIYATFSLREASQPAAVPEPSSMALLGIGVAALAARRRRSS